VVFCDFTFAQNCLGAVGFVADTHCLADALTRQIEFLFVVGDFRCVIQPKDGEEEANKKKVKEKVVEKENRPLEEEFVYELTKFTKVFDWFKAKCRSIRFNAATIKVDNEVVPQMTEANHQAIIDRMTGRRALWKPDATAAKSILLQMHLKTFSKSEFWQIRIFPSHN
jgi:hypothetical protein